MYMIARLYASEDQAKAAVAELTEAGISSGQIAMLSNPAAREPVVSEGDMPAPEVTAVADPADMLTAVKAGKLLGSHADFYISRLETGRSLVVTAPHVMLSRAAENILDAHQPLADTHEPQRPVFVPVSEQSTPFSNMLGLPTLAEGTLSEFLGFGFKQEGVSHFSRAFAPLNSGWTFSSMLGMKTLSDNPTPLSSKFNLPISSDRNAGKLSKLATPFSSLLGLPLLTQRKHFLYYP